MNYGEVKWWSDERGYGFISTDNGGEVFVHFTGISGSGRRNLQKGQRVEFDVVQGPKGMQASDVIVVD